MVEMIEKVHRVDAIGIAGAIRRMPPVAFVLLNLQPLDLIICNGSTLIYVPDR